MINLFVYGTLKKNFHNHTVMGDAAYLGEAIVHDMTMHKGPGFPYATPSKGHHIKGELYSLNDLTRCDRLEGYPHHYQRMEVEVDCGDHSVKAWVYYVTNPIILKNYPETTDKWR